MRGPWRLLVVSVVLFLPSVSVWAQGETEPRTHTVRRGDTLWDLAQRYLGDPFQWPELHRRNAGTVQNPHRIFPEQVLVIGGNAPLAASAAADRLEPMDADALHAQSQHRDASLNAASTAEASVPANTTPGAVDRATAATSSARRALPPRAAVRGGDAIQAPVLWDAAGIAGAGRIVSTPEDARSAARRVRRPVQLYDRVDLELPAGLSTVVGDRLLVFRYGQTIAGHGRVVIPTGIVRVTDVAPDGRAGASLVSKFEDVFIEHGIAPLESLAPRVGVVPTPVTDGGITRILYIAGAPVLPTVGHQLILAAAPEARLVPGDQVTLVRDQRGDSIIRAGTADRAIAVLQVVRVTPWGASAMIVSQRDGHISPGMIGIVTAKMPAPSPQPSEP